MEDKMIEYVQNIINATKEYRGDENFYELTRFLSQEFSYCKRMLEECTGKKYTAKNGTLIEVKE